VSGRPEGLHYIGVENAIKPDTTLCRRCEEELG
jgi:hypothetical protein